MKELKWRAKTGHIDQNHAKKIYDPINAAPKPRNGGVYLRNCRWGSTVFPSVHGEAVVGMQAMGWYRAKSEPRNGSSYLTKLKEMVKFAAAMKGVREKDGYMGEEDRVGVRASSLTISDSDGRRMRFTGATLCSFEIFLIDRTKPPLPLHLRWTPPPSVVSRSIGVSPPHHSHSQPPLQISKKYMLVSKKFDQFWNYPARKGLLFWEFMCWGFDFIWFQVIILNLDYWYWCQGWRCSISDKRVIVYERDGGELS